MAENWESMKLLATSTSKGEPLYYLLIQVQGKYFCINYVKYEWRLKMFILWEDASSLRKASRTSGYRRKTDNASRIVTSKELRGSLRLCWRKTSEMADVPYLIQKTNVYIMKTTRKKHLVPESDNRTVWKYFTLNLSYTCIRYRMCCINSPRPLFSTRRRL